jgi:hypothetical protein
MIVEAAPAVSGSRPTDRNIAANAADEDGVHRSHVRGLEALRRAGQERIDADHWKIPKDIVERGQAHDLRHGGQSSMSRCIDLNQQGRLNST